MECVYFSVLPYLVCFTPLISTCRTLAPTRQHVHFSTHARTHTHTHTPCIHVLTHAQDEEDDEVTPGYKAPKQVDLKTLKELDADDESLVKYKEQLLGKQEAVLGMATCSRSYFHDSFVFFCVGY